MPRARDLGLPFPGTPGPFNAITDVPGVEVGFERILDPHRWLRTGVTAILPRGRDPAPRPVRAGHFALNGNGEMTGTHWIGDAGHFLGPVLITNTHAVGACHTAATRWMIDTHADHFSDHQAWAMPVVAETYDGVLNDINAMAVTPAHARAALEAAQSGPVAEGGVGGGTGMIAYEFAAGTGTASRKVALGPGYVVAALVQANHGIRPWLTILGRSVGRAMPDHRFLERETGSIIVILATDAPLSALSLRALARRAALGVGRGGSPGGDSSGDIFLAFSTTDPLPLSGDASWIETVPQITAPHLDPFYLAAVETVEEAVVNALTAGTAAPTFKPRGRICRAIDPEQLRTLFGS